MRDQRLALRCLKPLLRMTPTGPGRRLLTCGASRLYSSSSDASSPLLDFESIRASMLARAAKRTYDVMSPTPSHLLNTVLSDFLPASCQPPNFAPDFSLPVSATPAPALPEGHHNVYFPLQLPASGLGPDGTDPHHSPGGAFERRMWAGGSVTFHAQQPLRLDGRRAVCVESIDDVTVKGRAGEEKIFVDLRRVYGEEDQPASVEERRSLVFLRNVTPESRAAAAAANSSPRRIVKAPHPPDFTVSLTPPISLLFHFSALTFNAHQIHLNPEYSREVEGYRNIIVHGPLSLTLMLSVARSQLGSNEHIGSIEYRNLAPLYADEKITVCIRRKAAKTKVPGTREWDVWVEGPDGGLSVRGTVVSLLSY